MTPEEKKLVLVVDDTPANIQIVQSILKDSYRLRVATNGTKALELANADPQPDLILLDVMMPGIDGFEVCTRLKASEGTREIPVIFLTGQTEIEDETRGFELGGVDYIHKPFSHAVVQARVNTHLNLRAIRQQLALQLHSIRSELETARLIQQSILPSRMPPIAALDIAARYIPMTEVAGDFYDFIEVDDKHLGVLIADVSGHGMPSALISSMLKIALAAQTPHASQPAQVIGGLNQALCGKFQGHFVTAAYIFIDLEKNTLSYSGAGHPPILVRNHATGEVTAVLENGLFLGSFDFAAYTSVEVPFNPGDWCLLYTDGIAESSTPAGEEFGIDGIKQFIADNSNLSADEFADHLLETVYKWIDKASGRGTEDDLTLLAIHHK
jgi:sigma-B regulation protein RsbU (phosphoserine phosphatase)